jgi:hypothetical protein
VTDVLVVTTTVGVLHGVHRHTTHARPRVALGLVLVVRSAGLEERLVDTTTASGNADARTGHRRDDLLGARRKPNPRLARLLQASQDDETERGQAGGWVGG